mmetsp:Transcript_7868/g.12304  ORF Transcript_7868/g.12304 Transcript_7868/m.12304 type:complete len:381 (+) Transcript_7868:58-1200(+)
MVILTSDSCCTLVSLDGFEKSRRSDDRQPIVDFVQTNIYLPADEFEDDSECDMGSEQKFAQHLYLPTKGSPVDQYLRSISRIMETADELLAKPLRTFSAESRERLLYVSQGEVAHTTVQQCDVITSDKSTTCHILAFRSVSAEYGPIVSMAHIDSISYESCIRAMVQEHKSSHDGCHISPVEIDVHILGGFNDKEELSQSLSNFIFGQLSKIVSEENDIHLTLRTCAISSINDNGHSCPIGRGMGISVSTGNVFLAKVDEAVKGPLQELRAARLWSSDDDNKLSIIQSISSDKFYIQAFVCEAVEQMKVLLELPDDLLMECVSTSPEVEEDDFCSSVRSSLRWITEMKCEAVFEKPSSSTFLEPAVFQRVGGTNHWVRSS